jgi:aminopeptidase-like protein
MYPGKQIFNHIKNVFEFKRSLLGDGVRETLTYIEAELPHLAILGVKSGTNVADWVVPDEWIVRDAYIANLNGKKIIDIDSNFLHVVGHSMAISKIVSREELQAKLYTSLKRPDAIPYVTSYYERDWGFCVTEKQKEEFFDPFYKVYIDSEFKKGELNYAELIIPGASRKEILFSSYICHPNMANNELSGPFLQLELARYVQKMVDRKYTYRFVWLPETIGAINYLQKNLLQLTGNVIAGFVLTCLGDEGSFSYLPSPYANTLADKLAVSSLRALNLDYVTYSFLDRGSDERQYCSPSARLPVVSVMRSKYGEYDEYHTSADDLNFVTPTGLEQSFQYYLYLIGLIEKTDVPTARHLGEPMLGKRGLYSSISQVGSAIESQVILDFLTYSDGTNDLDDISMLIRQPLEKVIEINVMCKEQGLLE